MTAKPARYDVRQVLGRETRAPGLAVLNRVWMLAREAPDADGLTDRPTNELNI